MNRGTSAKLGRCSAITLSVALLGVGMVGCDDDAVGPAAETATSEEAPLVLQQGLNVYLVVSSAAAPVGSEITVEAKVRAVGDHLVPTAFVANLQFAAERLELLSEISLDDGVLRVANLEAEPGVAKVAGAAANGMGTETLFVVRMKVKDVGYLEGLAVAVGELDVLRQNFAATPQPPFLPQRVIGPETPVVEQLR